MARRPQRSKRAMRRHLELVLLVALAAGYFAWLAWPGIWTGSENQRLVAALNVDEEYHLRLLKRAIGQRTFEFEFGSYGHLYFNMALVPLFVAGFFREVSGQCIIVTLRVVPTVCAVGTVAVAFVLSRRFFGRVAGWLAAALMSTACLSFLRFSAISHPDVPQAFFFLLGVYFCCRLVEDGRRKWLLWASACAGLAFACKYSGAFLLPVIWAVGLAQSFMTKDGEEGEVQAQQLTSLARWIVALLSVPIGVLVGVVLKSHTGRGSLSFLLGLCCVAGLLAFSRGLRAAAQRVPRLADSASKVLVSLVVFGVAFALSSPYSFGEWRFVRGILYESQHTALGHGFFDHGSGLLWLAHLTSSNGIDAFLLGLALIGLIVLVWGTFTSGGERVEGRGGRAAQMSCSFPRPPTLAPRPSIRGGWRRLVSPEGAMWACVVLYVAFLMVRVRMQRVYYLLPVIPILLVLATQPVGVAIRWASRRLSRRGTVVLACLMLALIGGLVLPQSLGRLIAFRRDMLEREEKNDSVRAGRWLAQRYPASTRILCDRYCYVPPSFGIMKHTFGGTMGWVEKVRPDVIIVHQEIARRYADPGRARDCRTGEAEFKKRHDYYEALRSGAAGFALVRDFGDVQVYQKR